MSDLFVWKENHAPTFHRDGTISYYSESLCVWRRSSIIPTADVVGFSRRRAVKFCRHLERCAAARHGKPGVAS